MHHLDPIAQRIHDHAQYHRVLHVQRIARARGVIDVAFIIAGHVIGRVVDAAERQGRPHLVAFAGVVIDDV